MRMTTVGDGRRSFTTFRYPSVDSSRLVRKEPVRMSTSPPGDEDRTGRPGRAPHRVLLVGSSGGHLTQLLKLEPWWRGHDRRWVVFDTPEARARLEQEAVVPAHFPTTRNARNAVRNLALARRVLREYRPDVVVSCGAGVAVPFFVLAKARGVRTVYLEVYDRVDLATLTGRLCYPFTDLFLLQWEEQRQQYKRGVVIGSLF